MAPLDAEEQQLYSEPLLDVRAPHPISKAESSHPAKEAPQFSVNVFDFTLVKSLGKAELSQKVIL